MRDNVLLTLSSNITDPCYRAMLASFALLSPHLLHLFSGGLNDDNI